MPNRPEVFLGLVTHSQSAFNQDSRATRLLEQVTNGLKDAGMSAECLVSDRNDYCAQTFPINRTTLLAAAQAQANLEHEWRVFIAQRSGLKENNFREQYLYQGMRIKRTIAALKGKNSLSAKAYQRLLNIDLSHHRVLTQGIQSGAQALVILEDDASLADPHKVSDLAQLIRMAILKQTDFINLSESISAPGLGIERILNRGRKIDCETDLHIVELDTPVTNTVCANYYSRRFATQFQSHIAPERLIPVKPIDWRLNEVMLENQKTSCWWVEPGIFVQGSMHETTPSV